MIQVMEGESPPSYSQLVTNPEDLAEAIRSAEFEPCLLKRSPVPSWIARVSCPQLCLDFARLGSPFLFTGVMPKDCYTLIFVIDCPRKANTFNFGTQHHDGYLGFFPPGWELDAYTPQGYSNATLTVPAAIFHAAMETSFSEIPEQFLQRGTILRIGKAEQASLRALLSTVVKAIEESDSSLAGQAVLRGVERNLFDEFLQVLQAGAGVIAPSITSRTAGAAKHLRKARDFIQENSRGALQLDELSALLGMSRRGVELMFRKSLGIGPGAFIRQQRLHGVRRELLAAQPQSGVIKELALEWGFWHMGHFSRNYRTLFGEMPTSTLGRS
jgi:AraC-like DNA-binding protein